MCENRSIIYAVNHYYSLQLIVNKHNIINMHAKQGP